MKPHECDDRIFQLPQNLERAKEGSPFYKIKKTENKTTTMMTDEQWAALKEKANSTTKRSNPKHEESKLQISCVTWFRLQYPQYILFAVPNGGFRNGREAGILKAEGVLSGVADLFLLFPSKGYAGLFVEMKFGNGKQSAEQIKFQKNAEQQGYKYVVTNSLECFMKEINSYIK